MRAAAATTSPTPLSQLGDFSALLDLVYQGATEPERWPTVLDAAAAWMGSPKALLFTPLHVPEAGGYYFNHGFTEQILTLWRSKYQGADLWTQTGIRQGVFAEGNVVIGTDVVPHETLLRSDWYREFLVRAQVSRLISSVVFGAQGTEHASGPVLPTVCAFYRGEVDPAYTEPDRSRLALLMPHLSRSIGVMTRLRDAEMKVAANLGALDRVGTAVLLLTGTGDVLFANRPAGLVLAHGEGIALREAPQAIGLGRLVATDAQADAALGRALRQADAGDEAEAVAHFSSVLRLPKAAGGKPLLLQLSRLAKTNEFRASGMAPALIGFVTDPDSPTEVDQALLQQVFGLSPAEARVAVLSLCAGSVDDLAAVLALSPNTVKTQIKQLYAKTGVANRAALVRLLVGLARVG